MRVKTKKKLFIFEINKIKNSKKNSFFKMTKAKTMLIINTNQIKVVIVITVATISTLIPILI